MQGDALVWSSALSEQPPGRGFSIRGEFECRGSLVVVVTTTYSEIRPALPRGPNGQSLGEVRAAADHANTSQGIRGDKDRRLLPIAWSLSLGRDGDSCVGDDEAGFIALLPSRSLAPSEASHVISMSSHATTRWNTLALTKPHEHSINGLAVVVTHRHCSRRLRFPSAAEESESPETGCRYGNPLAAIPMRMLRTSCVDAMVRSPEAARHRPPRSRRSRNAMTRRRPLSR